MTTGRNFTRRQFLIRSAGATAVAAGVSRVAVGAKTAAVQVGKKGQVFPDQRKKHTDAGSGRTVWQLTDTPGRTTQTLYYTNRHATSDSRSLIYASDRASSPGELNLFKMDLRTGESIQLTESGVFEDTPDIAHNGREVYFIDLAKTFKVVNLDTLEEREIVNVGEKENVYRQTHALSLTPDDRYAIIAPHLEERRELRYQHNPTNVRSALIIIDTTTGETRRLIDGNSPLGHVAFSPTDGNQVLYSIHVSWWLGQRPWLIRADGTQNRPVFPQRHGEAAGHEFWGEGGQTVYATCYGGRTPQGLWASNLDGTNERCVLAGPTITHGTVSPEEDRFVVDEIYADTSSLWISRKGSPEPELLCKMKADWFETKPDGTISATSHHPHPHFLPNGQGVTFNSDGEIYLVEM